MLSPRPFPETSPSLLRRLRACGPDGGPDDGAEGGWREFFHSYAPAIYRIARARGLADADADDLVQQVMAILCKHIDDFDYDQDRGYFRRWVQRIAENQIVNTHRRRRPTGCDPEQFDDRPADGPSPEALWSREWQLQDMRYCLDQLAEEVVPRRMQAFRLYVLEGRSAEETAAAVGMSLGWVYVTRNQLLNMLRARMKALETRGKGDGRL